MNTTVLGTTVINPQISQPRTQYFSINCSANFKSK